MTDSEPVSKYPCKVKKASKTEDMTDTMDQKMDKYPVSGSPFVVPHLLINKKKLMFQIADNSKVTYKVDAPPPSYKSMIQEFLMDEPPQYGYATGVAINVKEVKLILTVCCNA